MSKRWLQSVALASALVGWGCSSGSSGGGAGSSESSSASSAGQSGSSSGGSSASGGSSSSKSSSGGSSATGGSSEAGSSSVGGSSNTGGKGGGGAGGGGNGGKAGAGGGGSGGKAGAGGTSSSAGGDEGGTTETGGTSAKGGTGGKGGTTGAAGTTETGGAGGGGGGAVTTGPVTVQLDKTRQTIEGFGINDTWGKVLSDAAAKEMFDQSTGLGLSILRVGMSPSGGFYNSDEATRISQAKKLGVTKIIGSVWSPPADCKTNGNTQKGGFLKEGTCYDSWSDSIAKFAKDNSLYAMSAGNEPDYASCASSKGPPCNDADYDTTVYTAKQMVAFVKKLGPKLKAANVKLITPEASEWIHTWSNLSATNSTVSGKPNSSDPLSCGCFANTVATGNTDKCAATCMEGNGYDYGHWLYKDKDAWGFVDILGVHQYDSQVAEPWPADVNGGRPDKSIWQTEMSGVMYWPEAGPSTTIENAVAVAGWLHSALTVGEANAWLWWWYNGTSTNEGLYNNGTDTKRHYSYGNFTKFIRPGYVRVEVDGSSPADVLLSAYKGTDGTVAIVAINKGTGEAKFPITVAGGTPASCTPTVTSASDNLKAGTAVTVSDGTFTATLASKTVTTFVCK
jgi:glucuronoarabinoxylan endo-1,4-beta-xylanase